MFLLPMVDSKGKKPFVKMVFVVLLWIPYVLQV